MEGREREKMGKRREKRRERKWEGKAGIQGRGGMRGRGERLEEKEKGSCKNKTWSRIVSKFSLIGRHSMGEHLP